ncbi:MAG: hypothetical protein K2J65_09650 [Duncaniella sp.]|nr:hypothetical protein [Duncaniella sp.]
MKKFFISVALLATGATLGHYLNPGRFHNPHTNRDRVTDERIYTDTVTVFDTCIVKIRTPADSANVRYITRHLPVPASTDSIYHPPTDSATVQLPVTRKIYEDSLYRAIISGYEPNLDSLTIFPTVRTVQKSHFVSAKDSRWGIGITAGASLTPGGFHPSVSIGVTYRLITF